MNLPFNNVIFYVNIMLFIDKFEEANRKLKKYKEFSDVQFSALENKEQQRKRQKKPNSRYIKLSN